MEEDELEEADLRLVFMYSYFSKTSKFKLEKWHKMMATEDYKNIVMDFLNNPKLEKLILTLSPAGVIIPSLSFPANPKTKSSYFIRRSPDPITDENVKRILIYGDVSGRPIDELAVLVQEVYLPILTSPKNLDSWPKEIANDIKLYVNELKDVVFRVKGQVTGSVLLPMPDGVNKFEVEEQRLIASGGKDVDMSIKNAIEASVIKWSAQISEVLNESSASAFEKEPYPVPERDFEFWQERVQSLESIYTQLKDDNVRRMAGILEKSNSAYIACFQTTFKNVVAALKEAREIYKYLQCLVRYFDEIQSLGIIDASKCFLPLFHTLGLIWIYCPYFRSTSKLLNFIQEINNFIIQESNSFLDPGSLFQGEPEETLPKVLKVVEVLHFFKEVFARYQDDIVNYFPEGAEIAPWNFHMKMIFERFDNYVERLNLVENLLKNTVEYLKLEKVEVGGYHGRSQSHLLVDLYEAYGAAFGRLRNITYDPLDLADDSFLHDYEIYMGQIQDFDQKLAHIISVSYDDCNNFEAIFKMFNIFGGLLERPAVRNEMEPKYSNLIKMMSDEADAEKELYDIQLKQYQEKGFVEVPPFWPPVAGALLWIESMMARLKYPLEHLANIEHSQIAKHPDMEYSKKKAWQMLDLLEDFKKQVFTEWADRVPEEIRVGLAKSIVLVLPDDLLALNFDPELTATLKEVKYMKLLEIQDIPNDALDLFERNEEFYYLTTTLRKIIEWYNRLRTKSRPQEFALISDEVADIDTLIAEIIQSFDWNSPEVSEYVERLNVLVYNLNERVIHAQDNLEKITTLINQWNFKPLYNRPEGRKDLPLIYSDMDKIFKVYDEVVAAGEEIYTLIEENYKLLHNLPLVKEGESPASEEEELEGEQAKPEEEEEEGIEMIHGDEDMEGEEDEHREGGAKEAHPEAVEPQHSPEHPPPEEKKHSLSAPTEEQAEGEDEEGDEPKEEEAGESHRESQTRKKGSKASVRESQSPERESVTGQEDRGSLEQRESVEHRANVESGRPSSARPSQVIRQSVRRSQARQSTRGDESDATTTDVSDIPTDEEEEEEPMPKFDRPAEKAMWLSELWKTIRSPKRPVIPEVVEEVIPEHPIEKKKKETKANKKNKEGKKKGKEKKAKKDKESKKKEKKGKKKGKDKKKDKGEIRKESAVEEPEEIIPLSPSEELMKKFLANPEKVKRWDKYLDLVDDLVGEGLFHAVGVSIGFFTDEMDIKQVHSPLMEIVMYLDEPVISFNPSLALDFIEDVSTLYGLIHLIIKDINCIGLLVPRISFKRRETTYMDDIIQQEDIRSMEEETVTRFQIIIAKVKKFSQPFNKHAYLWQDSRQDFLRQFLTYGRYLTGAEIDLEGKLDDDGKPFLDTNSPKLEHFKVQIDHYEALHKELMKLIVNEEVIETWLKVDLRLFKTALLNHALKWSNLFKQHLFDDVVNKLTSLDKFIIEAEEGLNKPLVKGDYDGLVAIMGYLIKVRDRTSEADTMFEPIKNTIDLVKTYGIDFSEEIYILLNELPDKWNALKKLSLQVRAVATPLIQAESNTIRKRIMCFDIRQNLYRELFKKKPFFFWDCENPYIEIDKVHAELMGLEALMEKLTEQAGLFEVSVPEFKVIKQISKELKLIKLNWDYILVIMSCIHEWESTVWKKIDSEVIDMELKKFSKELRTLDKDMRAWDIFLTLENTIKNMITALRAITELQNPAIRDRHWKQLMQATKVKFVIDDDTTLLDLLDLNLHKFEEEVKTIVDKSVKEMGMEKSLKEFAINWATAEFEYEAHPRTGSKLVRVAEEIMEILEDNQSQLQNMLSSKYIGFFQDEVSDWARKLVTADSVITIWLEVQRAWMYLEAIFIGSDDIRRQLPEDSRIFDRVDKEFRAMLQDACQVPNVVKMTNRPNLLPRLESLQVDLTRCEKALAEYLETKRLAYPRFYFISSADLLDILSNGNQPELVCKHLSKLYDSLAKLKFITSDGRQTKTAKGMWAKDGEYVEFNTNCDCSGQVEIWLNNVTDVMRSTGLHYFKEAVVTYDEKPREQWVFDYPAQCALCGTQIWWASEVSIAFERLEEGYENALKDYQKKQISQLNALINILLQELTSGDRQKIMTICTIDVHSRDVVAKLIMAKVEMSSAFQWQSQLRHRWDFQLKDCYVNICDAQFHYDYEYLGNTPRLVITPLTDRCYITLTQSLHLILGGAPAGPAGTGKTETTKDLGKALGMMVYVFNCSEQMDYKSCGNIYKGLAQTGAWGCFDEFNRISVEVLSVVAVQVKTVLDAIKAKKQMFYFQGDYIQLIPTVGMFITMNPGYAGRAELPENLKALFRPCAMVVPDFDLICEIMLIAEGFQDARPLARKFITLYSLCKELLSKQDHYDWGLRAIKSVLVVAGSLKRGDRNRPEDQVLMRALRDFNIPKIVTDDTPIFMGLIGDLFPALDVPRKRDLDFEKQVRVATIDNKLQPEDGFVLKVVQLQELFAVRHSVFIVGNAGTGKSCVWKTLYRTYFNMKLKPYFNDLEPKSVTNNELFGIINPATREWKDGLFSTLLRDQANMAGDGPKWMVMDGDIDPMWIESLNTVMDDNKVLTLASNERIALTKGMRLLFEISHLRTATPATVSRAGILYINPADLGWNPFVQSWVEKRPNENERILLMSLFDKYIPPVLEASKTKFKKITPIPEIASIQMLCKLLDLLLTHQNVPTDCPKEWYEIYFVFACVWAFGSACFQDQLVDWRSEFTKWWTNEFKSVKFPATGHVFNYYIDQETKKFLPWTELLRPFELDIDIPLQSTLVNTAETTRVRYFLDLLIGIRAPVMLIGGSGSGKTVLINDKMSTMPDMYAVTNISFNFYTTSEMLQKVLEKPLEKKAGRNFGPPGNKVMIYFIDDLNMPEVDKYGTVQPHTLIRQHMDYQHWYDRQKLTLKDINNIMFISCMNPTSGSFTIDPRLQRHFSVFALSFPGQEALHHIYSNILTQFLQGSHAKFPITVVRTVDTVLQCALYLHSRIQQTFLPTAIKFHYLWNLRDLSNIFQTIILASPDCISTPGRFVKLWIHEASRVYGDKMVDFKDQDLYNKLVAETAKKMINEIPEAEYMSIPNLFCHFVDGIGDPKYLPVPSWQQLNKILMDAQNQYNDLVGNMSLVLFEDAMGHVCRINRVMESPRGNALLVGVGGSGKQSLARLSAFISSLESFLIQLKKGYSLGDLKADIASLYIKTGQKNVGVMFLITDSQIADEKFLVLINDMLASGEISELFADDEMESIIQSVAPEVKSAGLLDTRENCWRFFIERSRKQLKTILSFSPVGSTLRIRARKFPAIVNCTTIDWFMEWPKEALESVSLRFLKELDTLPGPLAMSLSLMMAFIHHSVNSISNVYLTNEKRYNYTTPKSFLEMLELYTELLSFKTKEIVTKIQRLQTGLHKLVSCAEQVGGLKKQLAEQGVVVEQKNRAASELIKIVGKETEKVAKEKTFVAEEERKVRIIEEDISVKQKICEEDLVKAEPALLAAQEALNTLNKNNLTELKSFGSPPDAVAKIAAAVIVLLAPKGKVPKDRSWKAAKVVMGSADSFLSRLVNYDKEHISPDVVKAVQPYLIDPEFSPEFVLSKSSAAAGLCAWVINIMKFYDVWCVVYPKRKALATANAELASARNKLEELKEKITKLEIQLGELTMKFEEAIAEKLKCETEVERTAEAIDLANRLVNGLASENSRWKDTVSFLQGQGTTLPGDILIVTSFISFIGYFTKKYREELIYKYWIPQLSKFKPEIPVSDNLDPLAAIADDAQIAEWNNEGLPNDRMSSENAAILTSSVRWPLIVDPQLQGIKWIKSRYGEALKVIRVGQKNYMDRIEKAISDGVVMLMENIGETLDPVLDNLLGRNFIRKGRVVKIGDKEVDFNPKFRMILHTKLANPHYKPEMQAQTTLINFMVTKEGLEEQLLAEVVKVERPDLEELKNQLTKQQNHFKITLKRLEDSLLERLTNAGPDILSDRDLVENLENTKKTSEEIAVKVEEAKKTSKSIDTVREMYRPVAIRASIIYFILNEMSKINPLYQFSLKAFNIVFNNAMKKAIPADTVQERILNLIDSISYASFLYTTRCLFERDKLIFMAQTTIQILLRSEEISPTEVDFLLRFPYVPNLTSPVDFLTGVLWGGIKALVMMDEFRNLDKDIEGSAKRWKKFIEGDTPERDKFPQDWKNKSSLQRLCMMRSMRPDRMTYAARCFVEENLGTKYVDIRTTEFSKSYEETSSTVPMFFILSPGVDPTRDVEKIGKKLGFTADKKNFHNISLGQGQEVVAENAMELASKSGHWVILQNIHLVANWLPTLDKKMEACQEHPHNKYRLFLSAEPAGDPSMHAIPQGVLENSIKITNEPPSGMQANLHKALDNFNQETLEMCTKEAEFKAILFALCYFHASVAERKKFGPQGWNRSYPFNVGDLTISVSVLYNYLENNTKIPWEDLRYLFGEIMYGGHITDDWDRRLCRTYLQVFLNPELLEGDLMYAPGFPCPPNTDYNGYHNYIDHAIPIENPTLYGLHPNAEIGFLTTQAEFMFRVIFEMQPRDTGTAGIGGISREDKVKGILEDLLDKCPEEFSLLDLMARTEERTPYIIVAFQECERMNILMREIKRSLRELNLGLKGELTITREMEELENSLFIDIVPERWMARAYPSMLGLTAWFMDLQSRLRELESWIGDFNLPSSVWLAGFFNPQSFLTAIMQSTARKNEWPLDKMCLQCDVTKKFREEVSNAPREGAYINSLYMEGARWDMQAGVITDSRVKEMFPMLPLIHVKAITQDKQETRNVYDCPVYKTRLRGPTFVWTFVLKTKDKPSKWILAGVGILLCI